jgi:lipopolysaccharide export system protein LptA
MRPRWSSIHQGRRWTLLAGLLLGLALAQQAPAPLPPPPTAPVTNPAETPEGAPLDPLAPADGIGGGSAQLTRKAKDGKERFIKIVRTGLTDDTGVFVACTPQDDDPEGSPTLSVFSETGPGGVQVTVDKNVIRAPLALVTQQDGGDGHIEVSAGTARFLDEPPEGKTDRLSRCAIEATPQTTPNTVFVIQGKTNLKGQKLVYDEKDGIARIDGPITFERPAPDGKPTTDRLSGTSQRIEVNVDSETTTLAGEVVLTSGERTSRAERVDYDDAKNVAILRGSPGKPAQSVQGKDILCAPIISYNLDRNTAVVLKGDSPTITGSFDDGDAGTSSPPVNGAASGEASGPPSGC